MYRIENWSVADSGDLYTPPELRRPVLQGNVFGHPNIIEGDYTHTSPIVCLVGGHVMTYSGSLYELGEVDPKWESLFPNSKARFLASFDEKGNMKKEVDDASK